MYSMHEQSAELIDLVEKSGMRAELEARVEAQNLEAWKMKIAALHAQRKERDAVMPALHAADIEAREIVALTERKLLAAKQVMNHTSQRVYVATCHYSDDAKIASIEKLAPRFLQDAYDDLQEPIDFLRGTVRTHSRSQRVPWSFHSIDVSVSNADEVHAIHQRCEDGQAEIRAMMQDDVTPLDEHRARCAAIVQECLAMTQPHLKDDKHWLLHEQRMERAKRKTT
ncbi:hypothetical protein PQQ87_32260 [Paraburkholderia nemoris]|uniref:hypothetical protein n=1 Tax=Paraburkholderia nemoris TaxID=2793076 RepID=UPI0038B73961